MSTPKQTDGLSADQVEQFREDGYLLVEDVFGTEEIEEMRTEATRILELAINAMKVSDRTQGRVRIVERDDGGHAVKSLTPFVDMSRLFKRVATERLIPYLEPLVGEDPVLMEEIAQINYKWPLSERVSDVPVAGRDTSWEVHADWPYYASWAPGRLLTSLVFLDECTPHNGPMQVWPGTHTQDTPHKPSDAGLEVPDGVVDHEGGVEVTGPTGSVLFMRSNLVHASEQNTTDRPRRLAIFRHAAGEDVTGPVVDGAARPMDDGPNELVETTYEHEYLRQRERGMLDVEPFEL